MLNRAVAELDEVDLPVGGAAGEVAVFAAAQVAFDPPTVAVTRH